MNRFVRPILAVIFVILLGSVYWLNHRRPASISVSGKQAQARYGFSLTEISHQSGIDFTHQAPQLDSQLANVMPQVASMGASVSMVDYDKDGNTDIYICDSQIGGQNHLYRNLGNGKFQDVAPQLGLADLNKSGTGVCMGAVWGDYDNDGYEDVLIVKWGRPLLLHNDQGKGFTDVTATAGLPSWINSVAATWVDYDRDGKLDLVLCGYYPQDTDLWHLKNTRMMPDSLEYAKNGARRYLLHNMGNGKFEDVTDQMGLTSRHWTLAVTTADLRGTGYPDLIFANDYGEAEIYANQNGQGFQEIAQNAIYSDGREGPKSGMNAAVGDYLNQGQYAIYVSNITSSGNLTQYNNLWTPRPGTSGNAIQYDNYATAAGVGDGGWSFGAQFGDLNNDGYLDILLTNGYISHNHERDYWYDYSKLSGGASKIVSDAQNWPAMGDASLSGYEQKKIWINDGAGHFSEAAQAVGYTDTHDGRAVALGDLFNDGALDAVITNQGGPLLLYKNTVTPLNDWIEFTLEGTHANRSAIGAQVEVYWKNDKGQPMQQLQQVSAASGFCAENQRRLHFGLGTHPQIEKVTVRWPSNSPLETLPASQMQLHADNQVKEPL